MRTLGYIAAKRRAVDWLQRNGETVNGDTPLLDVAKLLEKRLNIRINGEMDKRFAMYVINVLFAWGESKEPSRPQRQQAA